MKKTLWKMFVFLLVLCMIFAAFAGCGKKADKKKDDKEAEEENSLVVQRTISPVIAEPEPSEPPITVTEDPETEDPEQTTEVVGEAPAGTVAVSYVSADEVNVREAPSSEGEVLGKMPLNTIVYVTNKDAGNDWAEISYNGKKAYIAAYYLKSLAEGTEVKPVCKGEVNGTDINLRSEGTTDSQVLGKVSRGTTLDVLKKDAGSEWSMVMQNGRVAFIATRYLDFK